MEQERVKRSKLFQVRLTPEEYALWESKAVAQGMTLSEYVRQQVRANIGRPLELVAVGQVA